MRISSPLSRVKESGGTTPVPVIRKAPKGKVFSRKRYSARVGLCASVQRASWPCKTPIARRARSPTIGVEQAADQSSPACTVPARNCGRRPWPGEDTRDSRPQCRASSYRCHGVADDLPCLIDQQRQFRFRHRPRRIFANAHMAARAGHAAGVALKNNSGRSAE